MATETIRLGQGKRCVQDAVSYAIGHRIRVEILAILNEGVHTHDELARMTGRTVSKIGHHIKELVDEGSIELARTEQVRNTTQHYYRAVCLPFFTDEEVAAMPPETKQAITGVILQAIMAESMASFWAGRMVADPRVWLSWRWFNVDAEGRDAIADEQARSWARIQEIEAESVDRRAKTSESAKSIIVAELGFVRHRTAPVPSPLAAKKNLTSH